MHKIESAKNMQSPLELCFVKFNITDVCSTLFNIYINLQRYLRILCDKNERIQEICRNMGIIHGS